MGHFSMEKSPPNGSILGGNQQDDPNASVTAPDGRFHTAPELVCADAAAFPRIGATNPHLTIVAIARRKARLLADRLAASR